VRTHQRNGSDWEDEQGSNSLLRYLWTEAVMHAVQKDPELRRFYGASSSRKDGKARSHGTKLGLRL